MHIELSERPDSDLRAYAADTTPNMHTGDHSYNNSMNQLVSDSYNFMTGVGVLEVPLKDQATQLLEGPPISEEGGAGAQNPSGTLMGTLYTNQQLPASSGEYPSNSESVVPTSHWENMNGAAGLFSNATMQNILNTGSAMMAAPPIVATAHPVVATSQLLVGLVRSQGSISNSSHGDHGSVYYTSAPANDVEQQPNLAHTLYNVNAPGYDSNGATYHSSWLDLAGVTVVPVMTSGRKHVSASSSQTGPSGAGSGNHLLGSPFLNSAQAILNEVCRVAALKRHPKPARSSDGQQHNSWNNMGSGGSLSTVEGNYAYNGREDSALLGSMMNEVDSVRDPVSVFNTHTSPQTIAVMHINPVESEMIQGLADAARTQDRDDLDSKKTKISFMHNEVDVRYRRYCDSLQLLITEFESQAGPNSATPYTILALPAMSPLFRCLKDAFGKQLKIVRKALGELSSEEKEQGDYQGVLTESLALRDQAEMENNVTFEQYDGEKAGYSDLLHEISANAQAPRVQNVNNDDTDININNIERQRMKAGNKTTTETKTEERNGEGTNQPATVDDKHTASKKSGKQILSFERSTPARGGPLEVFRLSQFIPGQRVWLSRLADVTVKVATGIIFDSQETFHTVRIKKPFVRIAILEVYKNVPLLHPVEEAGEHYMEDAKNSSILWLRNCTLVEK